MNGFADIVAKFQAMTSDGKITLTEAIRFTIESVNEIVQLTQVLPVEGARKKAVAMEAVERFIDQVITPLSITGVPVLETLVDRSLKAFLMATADASIEAAVRLFNQIGWPRAEELPEG